MRAWLDHQKLEIDGCGKKILLTVAGPGYHRHEIEGHCKNRFRGPPQKTITKKKYRRSISLKFSALLLLAILMTGCVSKYKTGVYEAPDQKLLANAAAYVMMANDGSYGSRQYSNSGYLLSSATNAAVSIHLIQVEQATRVETVEEALSRAGDMELTYVFQPTILHWEDRVTAWSGRPDRITIKIVVWSVKTGKSISSTVLHASSKWATFGGDHPQDLLPGAIKPFVNNLFNG